MATDPEQRAMPGAFFSNDELLERNRTAPPATAAPSPLRDQTTRYNSMEMPVRPTRPIAPTMPVRPTRLIAPTMPIIPQISPNPQVTTLPPQSHQRQKVFRRSEERWRQDDERFRQREKEFAESDEREEEAWRQVDKGFRAQDEALSRQDRELSRQHNEAFGYQDEMPYYTFGAPHRPLNMTSDPQRRTMPGSFDSADEYENNFTPSDNYNNFTSPAEMRSQPWQDADNAPYRNNLHILDPSSHYSLLLNGRIGNNPDITVRRAPRTRISQNVGLASAALRRNPSRKENLEMSPNLAGNWLPDLDPWVAGEVARASGTVVRRGKEGTAREVTARTAATSTATPAAAIRWSATTTPTTSPKTAKKATQKAAAPAPTPLTRDQEYKAHIDKLASLEASQKYWSSTGEMCDVKYTSLSSSLQSQLQNSTPLGAGGHGSVHRVICHGVPVARKSIHIDPLSLLTAIKTEVEHVRSLAGHTHMVQLVGTYLTEGHAYDVFHILTFPVADCDMHTFLDDYESSLTGPANAEGIKRMSTAAGLKPGAERYTPISAQLSTFLKQTLGCITAAIQYMHASKIAHDDIKPANVLLRDGSIYITDFGLSRDRRQAANTSTEMYPGHTRGWTAPEKEDMVLHNPFKADVYSVGCIYIHVISLLSGKKKMRDCAEILQSPSSRREAYIKEHFESFSEGAWSDGMIGESRQKLIELTVEMLLNDRDLRPTIVEANNRLLAIGGERRAFHGACCIQPHSDTVVKMAETSVASGVSKTTSSTIARQTTSVTVPPQSPSTTTRVEAKETIADDDYSVTITPATLR